MIMTLFKDLLSLETTFQSKVFPIFWQLCTEYYPEAKITYANTF